MTGESLAVVGGRVVPVAGDPIDGGTVLAEGGRITAVGTDLAIPPGARVIDAAGRWVLPGLIEAHAAMSACTRKAKARLDTNELTDPVTAQVRALDAINPADLGCRHAISGGVLAAEHDRDPAIPSAARPSRSSAGGGRPTRWCCASHPG